MGRIFCALILTAITLSRNFCSAAPVELEVDVVAPKGKFTALDMSLTFNGSDKGTTLLELPDQWGGERELYKAISKLRVEGATMGNSDAPDKRVLHHKPKARITLKYRVTQDENGPPPKEGGNDYRPIIQFDHFHVITNTVVIQPDSVGVEEIARFKISGIPKGLGFASNLQHGTMGRKLKFRDLIQGIMVGGDYRVIDAGGGARLAIRGKWERSDEQWRDAFKQLAQSQQTYWSASGEPFMVTIYPLSSKGTGYSSVGGTGLGDAFAMFATPNVDPPRIDRTMAHEMMHTWIPGRIGRLHKTDEQLDYWLSEGFTEWAMMRVMVRSKQWTPKVFVADFNEALRDYETSPARTAPNKLILEKFWTDQFAQKLPYQRGMLFAVYLDQKISAASKA